MQHLNKDVLFLIIEYGLIHDERNNLAKAFLFGSKRSREIFLGFARDKINKDAWYKNYIDQCLPCYVSVNVKARSWKKASGMQVSLIIDVKKLIARNLYISLFTTYHPVMSNADFNIIMDIPFCFR